MTGALSSVISKVISKKSNHCFKEYSLKVESQRLYPVQPVNRFASAKLYLVQQVSYMSHLFTLGISFSRQLPRKHVNIVVVESKKEDRSP